MKTRATADHYGSFHYDRDTKASFIHSCGIERTAGKKANTKEHKENINSNKQTDAFNTLLLGLLLQLYLQYIYSTYIYRQYILFSGKN